MEYEENPDKIKMKEYLTKNHSYSGWLSQFEVYKGIKDKEVYLVYNNKDNYNIEVMRIKDKVIINSLKGHNNKVIVIRYFKKENKEEYIISCDCNKIMIVWDIENNYNKKYKKEVSEYIIDALLLFNIDKKDYIILSSNNKGEYSKLYEMKENIEYKKEVYGTNNNETIYLIPWIYKNKYYIIECCYNKKISINNILEEECYDLKKEPEGIHYCGYIYNDNYLCVSDYDNGMIRIWDLVKKEIFKEIKYDVLNGKGIIGWNNKYTIVGCYGCFVIIDIEEGKKIKKINIDNTDYVCLIKKMKIDEKESLICSDSNNNIRLFSI